MIVRTTQSLFWYQFVCLKPEFWGHQQGDYTGGLSDGVRHGQGTLRWSNGNIYEGDFVNGGVG